MDYTYTTQQAIKLIENGFIVSEYNPYGSNKEWFATDLKQAFEIIELNPPKIVKKEEKEGIN